MECKDAGSVLVVGLGASAGGLHSLRPLLQALEPGRPIAYILAHHQGAGADTQMTALLAQVCRLTVVLATDGAPLCAGHVYVTPPGFDVVAVGGMLALLAPEADSLIAPSVNRLFRSLGELGPRAVGIVLSGAGRDGVDGAAAIRRGGGVVIAQLPEQALQRGMPDALIEAGVADHVGSIEQIAAWLNDGLNRLPQPPRASSEAADATFSDLLDMVTRASGIDLQRYKQSTLRRQAARRYLGLGLHTLPEYLDYVRREPEELLRLQQAFLISVSAFFRDGAAFAACEAALRHLLARKPGGVPLRVWVPGCASGEEAYSLAMLVAEILGPDLDPALLRIFATDIDPEGLDQARAGLYSASEVVALGSERCARFMQQEGKLWRVAPRLRECCVFARHDVIAHPPFINLDMVSCRNLLIYFTPAQQAELLRTFQYALRPDGLLLLGRSESVGVNSSGFAAVDSSNKLYRRRNLAGGMAERAFRQTPLINVSAPAMEKPAGTTQRKQLQTAALTAIAAHGPPAVLVDTKFEPLHFFANSHRYFALPEGSADFTIHVLCRPELRSELKAMCFRVMQESLSQLEGLPVDLLLDGEAMRVVPTLQRLDAGGERGSDFGFLLVFRETRLGADAASALADVPVQAGGEVQRLHQELSDTRENLQDVIDKLQASNEELQSVHEELQSSTEELQASNEELQASNEELTTLNEELRFKTQESTQLSVSLGNIQNSVRVGLVVVDQDGRVMRFNQLAGRVFGLVALDVGQFLYGVPCYLKLPELRANVSAVVTRGISLVERVHEGEFHYLMRIDPYKDENAAIGGAVLTFSDVSELHRAEQARLASEMRFRRVWEASMEGLLVADNGGYIVLANPSAEQMFGYGSGELAGLQVEDLVPEETRSAHVGYRAEFFARGDHTRKIAERPDLYGLRKDGTRFPVAISLSGFEQDGQRFALASVADVSVARRAINELRYSEKRLRNFVENLPAAVAMFDRDLRYVAASRRWCEDYGLVREELIGRQHYDVFPQIPEKWKAVHRRGMAGETVRAEMDRVLRADGRVQCLRWEVRPWVDSAGEIGGILISTEDVTESWEADQRRLRNAFLERELDILQGVLESSLAGYWDWNIAAGTEYMSPTFKRMFGYADDELANSPEVWQQLIFPEELPRVLDNFHEHVRTRGDTPFYNEVRYRHKNGSTVWVICAGKVVEWGDTGDPVRMVGCHIDVTSQHEKVEELILANSRADSASRAKSAFLANMSHEIRTPIHAIVGMAHVLRGRIRDPGHLSMLGKIDAAAAHLLGVINDILDLARIEADKLVLDDAGFMLNQAVENVASMVAQRVAAKGLQLKVEVAADLALVGDATRYTQALLNLAANAVKFTESGQICIRVFPLQVTETTVELRSEVEDSGPGIANEVLQRLFAPFEQGDMSSTRKAGGSGLGLTITRRLARLMQGDAGVDTQTGRGSTFWFTARFGVDTGRAADKLASVQRDSGAEQQIKTEFAGRCILVAEDEPVNQEVAALILQDLGLQVVVAENGEQAVHSVQNGAVDLVLMDMQMPVMSGLAATRAIRALGDKGELPIVAMTANAFEDDRRACLTAGMNDFLSKPIDPYRLYDVLLRWLRSGEPDADGEA